MEFNVQPLDLEELGFNVQTTRQFSINFDLDCQFDEFTVLVSISCQELML